MPDEIVQIAETAVDLICDKRVKKLTLEVRAGMKIIISLTAKEKIKISKEMKKSKEFEE